MFPVKLDCFFNSIFDDFLGSSYKANLPASGELEFEFAGFKKSEIQIKQENGYLLISGKNSKREKNYTVYLGHIPSEAIQATMEDGMLLLKIPEAKKKDKLIPIL